MPTLVLLEKDWDQAVERVRERENDPYVRHDDMTDSDFRCYNCLVSVAAETQFGGTSYTLETLQVESGPAEGEYYSKKMLYYVNIFDKHLDKGRLKPTRWPITIELEKITSKDPRSFWYNDD